MEKTPFWGMSVHSHRVRDKRNALPKVISAAFGELDCKCQQNPTFGVDRRLRVTDISDRRGRGPIASPPPGVARSGSGLREPHACRTCPELRQARLVGPLGGSPSFGRRSAIQQATAREFRPKGHDAGWGSGYPGWLITSRSPVRSRHPLPAYRARQPSSAAPFCPAWGSGIPRERKGAGRGPA
jgi:hypothetical protein